MQWGRKGEGEGKGQLLVAAAMGGGASLIQQDAEEEEVAGSCVGWKPQHKPNENNSNKQEVNGCSF